MKKRVYLAIFALTFGLCSGCGNKEADSDISGTEDTVFQTEEPLELSGTGNIDLSEKIRIPAEKMLIPVKKIMVPVKRILISNQPILRRSILRAIILRTSKKMWTM